MKKILTSCFAIIFSVGSFSQIPNWIWTRGSVGNFIAEGISVATDASGNAYITGGSNGATTFGAFTVGIGVFLVKYDASGNVLWARSAGFAGGSSVTVDALGNILLTGGFSNNSVTFGSYTLINTNPAYSDIYLAKYDTSGNVIWAKSAGGTDNDNSNCVSTDALGNIYITGNFWSSSITFGTDTLSNSGTQNILIVKYDPSGNVIWAKSAGGTGDDRAYTMVADSLGYTYVSGGFKSSSIIFGTDTLVNTNANYEDIFLTKYDPSGNVLWAKGAGGTNYDDGIAVALDASNNVFLTGQIFSPSAVFESQTIINYGNVNFFLAKYTSAGNMLWVKSGHGHQAETGYSLTIDHLYNVYLCGGFNTGFPSDTLIFGMDTLISPTTLPDPAFLYKLDSAGNVLCSSVLTSGGDDISDVAVDFSNNVYMVGDYYATTFILGNDTLSSPALENVFLAKWTCAENTGIGNITISGASNHIFLSPNPATNQLTIDNAELKIKEIEIYNVLGEKCLTPTLSKGEGVRVDVSLLQEGIYFLKVKGEKEEHMAKFVKQ